MKIRLSELIVVCRSSVERVPLSQISYFWGQIGSGKSSIVRLIDFTLAGDLTMTPALQSEFLGATLKLDIGEWSVELMRERNSGIIAVVAVKGDDHVNLLVPARKASEEELLPDSGIRVFSDLLFWFWGVPAPKVRRSKLRDDSDLSRLSLRDLLTYCYLDQDGIDSTFFHLEAEANVFKRDKSRDVLRYVIGFHQEKVTELESELEEIRARRVALQSGADALELALRDANILREDDFRARQLKDARELEEIRLSLFRLREGTVATAGHAVDSLRRRARDLSAEVAATREAIQALDALIERDRRLRNEMFALSARFQRMISASAALRGVSFHSCPRCDQVLPQRSNDLCELCGQPEPLIVPSREADLQATEIDAKSRIAELDSALKVHSAERQRQVALLGRLELDREGADRELENASKEYDSAYLSQALEMERRSAALEAQLLQQTQLLQLPERARKNREDAIALEGRESELRNQLRVARQLAEADSKNLKLLEALFLDCLVRMRLPGFSKNDHVRIATPAFLPEVVDDSAGELLRTSFSTLGSGGKKTLFKCAFALAVHRLAVAIGANNLPSILVFDSPMKNISERENRTQFEGFHALVYELAATELKDTQFILVDKEFLGPPVNSKLSIVIRHMRPDGAGEEAPLIGGYRGY